MNHMYSLIRHIVTILFLSTTSIVYSQGETSILFIGNSLTFTNNMPKMLKEIALANGTTVIVDTVVKRGMSLKYHSEQKKTYRKIRSRKWSYVIVQGHSTEFAHSTEIIDQNTIPYLRKLVDSIRRNNGCSQIILYETWGYQYGKVEIPDSETYEKMQNQIKLQTMRASEVLSIGVCPVGETWRKVLKADSTLKLYTADNYHPTKLGSYIAACTFYVAIFNKTAYGNTNKLNLSLSARKIIEKETALFLLGNRPKWRLKPLSLLETGYDLILQNNELNLVNRATNFTTINWYFGDGTTSKEINPKHTYAKKGTFIVNQVVMDKCNSVNLKRTIIVKAVN